MRLNQALEEKKLDVRLRDRLVADGKVSHGDVQNYLQNLPDDGENVANEDRARESN